MDLQFAVGLFLSALIGLSLGLIGGGGSIITVPVLVYALGVAPYDAVAMSLAVVGGTSLTGAFLHRRHGNLRIKSGLIFGVSGIFGAFGGSPLTKLLSPPALLMTFALLMLIVAVLMLKRKTENDSEIDALHNDLSVWKALLAGFGVGVMTGFLGVGGGFLIVPALVMFGGLGMKEAVGTSLFVIFLNCVAGLIGHATQNGFDLKLTALVTILAISGAVVGTSLAHRIEAKKLQKGFAVFILLTAVFLMAKNYGVFFGG
jgi:uncharacterized protein